MSTRYWDRVAHSWSEHIMCSLHEDVSGNIGALLRSVASRHRTILDFGCGVGGYVPFLSEHFGEVTASDPSPVCLAQAKSLAANLPNVDVRPIKALARRCSHPFDAVLLANVLLSPLHAERLKILRQALALLRRGGAAVLVVPSIESVQLSEVVRRSRFPRRRSAYSLSRSGRGSEAGVVAIHGRSTKHYAMDELRFQLREEGLEVTQLLRAEYPWSSEGFETLDERMSERPWDWVVSATKA